MESPLHPLPIETESLLQQHNGPVAISGQRGDYMLMRSDIYIAMLGLGDDDSSETLASVRRGLADLEAGQVQDLDEAFYELDAREQP